MRLNFCLILYRRRSYNESGQNSTDQKPSESSVRRDFRVRRLSNTVRGGQRDETKWPLCLRMQLEHVRTWSASRRVRSAATRVWSDQSKWAFSAPHVRQENLHFRSKSKPSWQMNNLGSMRCNNITIIILQTLKIQIYYILNSVA